MTAQLIISLAKRFLQSRLRAPLAILFQSAICEAGP
jgi:hypothetical protein